MTRLKLSLPGPKNVGGRQEPSDDQLRELRVAYARDNQAWTEIAPPERLVPRGPSGRWLVDAETDLIYAVRRGSAFAPGRTTPDFVVPSAPAWFYVDRTGELVLLERLHAGRTFSQISDRTGA